MKKLFATAFVFVFCGSLCASCLKDPYAAPFGYVRDDVYCWYNDADRGWSVRGLSDDCPPNTPYGTVPVTQK